MLVLSENPVSPAAVDRDDLAPHFRVAGEREPATDVRMRFSVKYRRPG
jgi:hypothetical protein